MDHEVLVHRLIACVCYLMAFVIFLSVLPPGVMASLFTGMAVLLAGLAFA